MEKITNKVQKEILQLLKRNISSCLYLAIDLEVYGIDHPNVSFWYDAQGQEAITVIMKYYDTLQIFSNDNNWKAENYAEFMLNLNPVAICGRKQMIMELEKYMPDYFSEYGVVIVDNNYREFRQFQQVREATVSDAAEIAKLMFMSEEFRANNSLNILEKQLKDRISNKLGRSYIIEEDGQIVAHTAIYAECGNVAVESGLVVHPDYKKKFYGLIIHEYIKKVLAQEGKELYGLRYNESMQKSAQKEKIQIMAECGRLIKKGKS